PHHPGPPEGKEGRRAAEGGGRGVGAGKNSDQGVDPLSFRSPGGGGGDDPAADKRRKGRDRMGMAAGEKNRGARHRPVYRDSKRRGPRGGGGRWDRRDHPAGRRPR